MILRACIHLQVDHAINFLPFPSIQYPNCKGAGSAHEHEEANINYHLGEVLGNNIAVFHISENRTSYGNADEITHSPRIAEDTRRCKIHLMTKYLDAHITIQCREHSAS